MNVGSGGGAAAAPTSGGAAAGGEAAAEDKKEEEKEEGTICSTFCNVLDGNTNKFNSQGGVRRGYGFRSLRLSGSYSILLVYLHCMATVFSVQHLAGRYGVAFYR